MSNPSSRALERATEIFEAATAKFLDTRATGIVPGVSDRKTLLVQEIAAGLDTAWNEGAVDAHRLWQSGALPAKAS